MAQIRLDEEVTADVDRFRDGEESRAAFVNNVLRDVFAAWDAPVRPRRMSSPARRVIPTPRRY